MKHVFLAIITACAFWVLPTAAQAQNCGAEGQRPCTVFERIPSCNSGLIENPPLVRCSRPASTPTRPQPVCGAEGQRACTLVERIPSCNANLAEVAGTCRGCGAEGELPCPVSVRVPSCDQGLIEDFGRGQCITPTNPADQLRARAEAEARAIAPLLRDIHDGFSGLGATTQNLQLLESLVRGNNHSEFLRIVSQQPRFQAVLALHQRYGFQTMAVSVSFGGSVGAGFFVDCGIAVNTQTGGSATPFYGTFTSGGVQLGGGVDLVVSGFYAPVSQLSGTATGIGGSFDLGSGVGLTQWFDSNSGAYLGFSAAVNGVGVGGGGFVGHGQTFANSGCS